METFNNNIIDKNKPIKQAPTNLLLSSKMTMAEKLEIFESRKFKVLRFLFEEDFSSLENLSLLLKTPKQTVIRGPISRRSAPLTF